MDGAPSLTPPGGWEAVHVGTADDGLVLGGLPVWSLPWLEEAGGPPVALPHPAHPAQRHAFTIYTIDEGSQVARFAAAELSNGVWGFYQWIVPADAASALSADGSLRYEHAQTRGDAAPLARLIDAASGKPLFDGAPWASSRVVPQADGALLLALQHGDWQELFRIDPLAGTFRDLAVAGPPRPLAELAVATRAARAACSDPARAYFGRRVAPDGSLLVLIEATEWSNSHWVRSPCVVAVATSRVLLDLWGSDWDAVPGFPRPGAVWLGLRRYHYGGNAEVEIDLATGRFALSGRSGPLDELIPALEAAARESAALAPPRQVRPRSTARRWLVALLILAAALAAIAAVTLATLHFRDEPPPRKLDSVPPMPLTRQRV